MPTYDGSHLSTNGPIQSLDDVQLSRPSPCELILVRVPDPAQIPARHGREKIDKAICLPHQFVDVLCLDASDFL